MDRQKRSKPAPDREPSQRPQSRDFLDDPLFAAKHEAITEFLRSTSLPLYSANARQQVPIGTGTLLEVLDRKYLVTAAHVVRALQGAGLGVPLDRTFKRIVGIGRCRTIMSSEDKHDVALISLDDKEVVARLGSWRYVQVGELGTPFFSGPFLLLGYLEPRQVRSGFNRPGQSVALIVGKHAGTVHRTADPFDPEYDMLLDWPSMQLAPRSEGGATPRLQGMSGCSVWAMEADALRSSALWTPLSQLRLVGIQSSAVHGSYIRAKRWHLLWSAFRDIDPNAADAVRSALDSHRAHLVKSTRPRRRTARRRNA